MLEQHVLPSRALDLEHHSGAIRVRGQVVEELDYGAPLGDIGGRKRLDVVVSEIVVVVQDCGPIGEQPEVCLEAVRTLPDGLVERRQRVLREPSRTAAMTEYQEGLSDRNLLSCRN